jgi:uncharacterized protein involved in type VI secretion and phage assembly
MFHVTGQTKLYKVRIGGLLEVDFNNKMKVDDSLGTLKVIRVKHVFDELGHYHNEFDAVPSKFNRIPSPDIDFPIAHAIPATVTDNEDPDGLGKIQVKFDFDKGYCDFWMPLLKPEAGGNPENRGFLFIPEKDDMVLVSFFESNPEFPFILGSMAHGKNATGQGGGKGNHIKSIRDKSGSEIVFNDKDGSITIKDKSGSDSVISFDGKQNIVVSTDKSITLVTGDSCLSMKSDGTIDLSGKKITIFGEEFSKLQSGAAAFKAYAREGGLSRVRGTTVDLQGSEKVNVESPAEVKIQASTLNADGSINANYTGGLIKINS